MLYKSWLTWGILFFTLTNTVAHPATSNMAYYVSDYIKSISSFVTTMGALIVTYKLSQIPDTEAGTRLIKRYVVLLTILNIADGIVILIDSMTLRYVANEVITKLFAPMAGIVFMEIRKKEAKKYGTDLAGMWRRMEFPKCVVLALGGIIAMFIYQPNMGLTIQQGLWLHYVGGLVADITILKTIYDKE